MKPGADGFMIAATYATDDDMGNLEGNDLPRKVDTDALMVVDAYNGLNRPHTYSDMTGYALERDLPARGVGGRRRGK